VTSKSRTAVFLLGLVAFAGGAVALAVRDRVRSGPAPLPAITIAGATRTEGCLLCHATTRGLGPAHASIGCSACHLGDANAREKDDAHRGIEVLSGDFASVDRTCGQGACHAVETARVRGSVMARTPGILAVDRFAFGESKSPDGEVESDLGALDPTKPAASPAESHARQLCGSCHLGARKERKGDLGPAARGGGCTACHLAAPFARTRDGGGPLHPDVSASISERRCEGCHARSARISLSYRGIVELEPSDPRVTRTLEDGRPAGNASADVHAKGRMTCIDCHTERELMGDGALHRHADEARDVTCEDCHRVAPSSPIDPDREAVAARLRASWVRRGLAPLSSAAPIRTRAGTPLVRTDATTQTLVRVDDGAPRAIPQASTRAYHALAGHGRLACTSCHAAWAPRCTSCHTRFDPRGEAVDHLSGANVTGRWIEEAGGNGFGPPLLAVGPRGRIEPFIEGMRMRIDGAGGRPIERTLFAPIDPHTTAKSRACASCHAPAKLEDVYPLAGETTRTGARLLDEGERVRVAQVGRCLGCHAKYEDPIYVDFLASVTRLAKHDAGRCTGRVD
jgi:hypothetical protein